MKHALAKPLSLVVALVVTVATAWMWSGSANARVTNDQPALVPNPMITVAHNVRGKATSKIVGTTSDGRQVTGSFVPLRFGATSSRLLVKGLISGVVHNASGTTSTFSVLKTLVPVKTLNGVPATSTGLAAAAATCDILHLVLAPLDLDLLGLQVHLDRVLLDIVAASGAGNLLGNLLMCGDGSARWWLVGPPRPHPRPTQPGPGRAAIRRLTTPVDLKGRSALAVHATPGLTGQSRTGQPRRLNQCRSPWSKALDLRRFVPARSQLPTFTRVRNRPPRRTERLNARARPHPNCNARTWKACTMPRREPGRATQKSSNRAAGPTRVRKVTCRSTRKPSRGRSGALTMTGRAEFGHRPQIGSRGIRMARATRLAGAGRTVATGADAC